MTRQTRRPVCVGYWTGSQEKTTNRRLRDGEEGANMLTEDEMEQLLEKTLEPGEEQEGDDD